MPSSKTQNPPEKWYKDGLKFECSACGDCCTGGEGYVWVNKEEIEQMTSVSGATSVAAFEKKYVRQVGIRKSLKEYKKDGACVLFDSKTRKCQVYEARPRQCRTWPFWDSNLRTPRDWKETCQVCPGAGKGKKYGVDHIEKERKTFHV